MAKHPAIFLDRDGTIIEENGYIDNTLNVEFFPYTLKHLNFYKNISYYL